MMTMAVPFVASCSLMEEDTSDCPEGLFVRFAYDFNTVQVNGRSADLFKDHVGHVRLYAYDEEGNLAASRTVSNIGFSAPLSEYGYTMHFDFSELAPGHSYRLQAVALDKDWDSIFSSPGAKYRIVGDPTVHENNLKVALDHAEEDGSGNPFAVSDEAPLDIFWHTLKVTSHDPVDGRPVVPIDATRPPYYAYPAPDQRVRVEAGKATYATVSLIRDTKHLSIGLHQVDPMLKSQLTANMFDVSVFDANCTADHCNAISKDHNLIYSPYASWTVRHDSDGSTYVETVHKGDIGSYAQTKAEEDEGKTVAERQAHYNVMFNRLMLNDDSETPNASLVIKAKDTGKTVVDINLPHYLSMGRDAYALSNYSHQEYLDREHDYHLDLFLMGDKWVAMEIHVLSWSKRIQNVDL